MFLQVKKLRLVKVAFEVRALQWCVVCEHVSVSECVSVSEYEYVEVGLCECASECDCVCQCVLDEGLSARGPVWQGQRE